MLESPYSARLPKQNLLGRILIARTKLVYKSAIVTLDQGSLFLTMVRDFSAKVTLKTVNTTGREGIRPHSEVTDRWLSH